MYVNSAFKKPLLDAQIATPCGHTFCGECVYRFQQTSRAIQCAMCRQVVIAFCKNIFASNLITAIDGECLACKGRIKLDAAKDHLGRCSEVEVVCLLCSEKLQRKHQDGHDCPMREIICNCGEKFNKKDEEHHQHLCSFKQIQCPFDCGELVERYVKKCM